MHEIMTYVKDRFEISNPNGVILISAVFLYLKHNFTAVLGYKHCVNCKMAMQFVSLWLLNRANTDGTFWHCFGISLFSSILLSHLRLQFFSRYKQPVKLFLFTWLLFKHYWRIFHFSKALVIIIMVRFAGFWQMFPRTIEEEASMSWAWFHSDLSVGDSWPHVVSQNFTKASVQFTAFPSSFTLHWCSRIKFSEHLDGAADFCGFI